ncbi:MAG: hypothetical protein ACXAD7_00945 [Candidatus Kariarchaeaceae archaeon]|jgi:hypothetical protein
MVKNISNPLNARKVAEIIAEDAGRKGISLDERTISVFLSDNKVVNIPSAIESLKDKGSIPKDFNLSEEGITKLVENDFMDKDSPVQLKKKTPKQAISDPIFLKSKKSLDILEFRNQFESLKKKVIKLRSGGLAKEDLDKFESRFFRPMKYFTESMKEKGIEVSELEAYAVIFSTDHLGLSDDSRENAYSIIFGRFNSIKDELETKYDIYYSWPEATGSMYIDFGKNYSIGPELADFAIRFKTVSGLDTYDDEVIQELFSQLIQGQLTDELINHRTIYRWAEKDEKIEEPMRWLIPPMGYNVSEDRKTAFLQTVITHTILSKIEEQKIYLLDLFEHIYTLSETDRIIYLTKRLEHALTRKSVGLQFGTTLANFYENFKTNPSKSAPFIDTTIRYFQKSGSIEILIQQMQHSMITGLKNSIGQIKKYIRNISEEKLKDSINTILYHALESTIPLLEEVSEFSELPYTPDLFQNYEAFNTILFTIDEDAKKSFLRILMDNSFKYTQEFARGLEPESKKPTSTEGGMSELTHDFISTASYIAKKNPDVNSMIDDLISKGIESNIAEIIVQVTSYLSYQIAGKEGESGKLLHSELVSFYESKIKKFDLIPSQNGTSIREIDIDLFYNFIYKELTQSHVLISIASKTKTEVFNAWTPLTELLSKNTLYLNEFIIPNMLYWQRIPKDLINQLLERKIIDKTMVKSLVDAAGRLHMLDAYAHLILGSQPNINTFEEAFKYIATVFNYPEKNYDTLATHFLLKRNSGEAEIVRETSILWFQLQDINGVRSE